MRITRTALPLLLVPALVMAAAPAARAQTEPPPPRTEPAPGWQPPPRFVDAWLRGGLFLSSTPQLLGAANRGTVGLGLGIRPLPMLSGEVEGSWINRDFAAPAGTSGRTTLESRGFSAGVRLHHLLWRLEPSALVAVAVLWNKLAVPSGNNPELAGSSVESATRAGLVAGAGIDVLISAELSVGVDWRWLLARASFPRLGGGTVDLSGHSLTGVARLYWP